MVSGLAAPHPYGAGAQQVLPWTLPSGTPTGVSDLFQGGESSSAADWKQHVQVLHGHHRGCSAAELCHCRCVAVVMALLSLELWG